MNDEATCYVGGLASEITEPVIEELFTQVGPMKTFTLKKGDSHNYALVEFEDEETVPFAIEVMDGIRLFNKSITVKPRNNTKQEEAWKKAQTERRQNDNQQSYLPQMDRDSSRKRDYNGDSNYNTPRSRNDNIRRPPFPPPPPPRLDPYLTPPPAPPSFMGYALGPDSRADRWHTPPTLDHVNPRIPPEYDVRFRDRNNHRSSDYNNYNSRGDNRDSRYDNRRHSDNRDNRRDERDHRYQSSASSSRSGGRRY